MLYLDFLIKYLPPCKVEIIVPLADKETETQGASLPRTAEPQSNQRQSGRAPHFSSLPTPRIGPRAPPEPQAETKSLK